MLQQRWLKARKKLLDQIRGQVRILSGSLTADLKKYSAAYRREFRLKWEHSSAKDFEADLAQIDLLLGGDFHAYAQSQRLHLRILRNLDRPVVLALECIESRHQKILDSYLKGRLSEDKFLSQVGWHTRWGFPWENYKPLFDWARKNRIPVCGLNKHEAKKTVSGFGRRDHHAALQIKKIRASYPDHLIYVVFGDLHLAQPHLPAALKKVFKRDLKPLILMQNSELLYFKIARERKVLEAEWLATSKNRYCLISSPPWVKWQSYLMYLEQNFDRGLEDDEGDEVDLTDQVGSLVSFLCKDLKIKVSTRDLAVYSPGQLSFENLMHQKLSSSQKKMAQRLVSEDRSFYIPELGLLYLSRLSINHAAALAGYFIHGQLSRGRVYWEQPRDFRRAVWVEAVGFFFSKLINHSRKSESLRSLKARLEAASAMDSVSEALRLALEYRLQEVIEAHRGRRKTLSFKSRKPWVYLEAARIVGEMMGDRLYTAYRTSKISRSTLVKLLQVNLDSPEFSSMYMSMVKKLEGSLGQSRSADETRMSW